MGTSLQVYPFAQIPKLMKTSAWKVVFNRDKVGRFFYNFLFSNTLFIPGTTDDTVKNFLKDVDLLEDFKNFVKINYKDDNIDTNENIKMMEVNKIDIENKPIGVTINSINEVKTKNVDNKNRNENGNEMEIKENENL